MERCQDHGCGYENRQEYCEQRASEPDGDASVVIDALEALLYDTGRVSSDTFTLATDRDGQHLERKFSVLYSGQGGWSWPLAETQVTITHDTDNTLHRNLYKVAVAWSVMRPECRGLVHQSIFSIDIYPARPVQSLVEHLDFIENKRESRSISGYDYQQLFEVLTLVADAHYAEKADDARAIA